MESKNRKINEKEWPERKQMVEEGRERETETVSICILYGGQENYKIIKQTDIGRKGREKNWCDDGKI
jgi:hypothetical protein